MKEPLYARVIGWALGVGLVCGAVLLVMLTIGLGYQIVGEFFLNDPPESQSDCPTGHVYIDYGETPQVGCMPEGVAREIGVWPKPEGE